MVLPVLYGRPEAEPALNIIVFFEHGCAKLALNLGRSLVRGRTDAGTQGRRDLGIFLPQGSRVFFLQELIQRACCFGTAHGSLLMGMYNEVYKQCPRCNDQYGYLQVSQIVLGFGSFYLDDPEDLATKLDEDQMRLLAEKIKDQWFHCPKCKSGFLLEETHQRRESLARELFGNAD